MKLAYPVFRLGQNEWNQHNFVIMYPFLAKLVMFAARLGLLGKKMAKLGLANYAKSKLVTLSIFGRTVG